MICATCGYPEADHDLTSLRCPLCSCGELPERHEAMVGPAAGCLCGCRRPARLHAIPGPVGAMFMGQMCPGRRGESGKWLLLRRGTFKPQAAAEPGLSSWRDIIAADTAERHRVSDEAKRAYEPPVILPPQVAARPPESSGEFASYRGQAVGLGRKAAEKGWTVGAAYWRAGDGTEGCAVQLSRGVLRAVATWSRKPGQINSRSGWATDAAYGWRTDVPAFPIELTITQLEGLI